MREWLKVTIQTFFKLGLFSAAIAYLSEVRRAGTERLGEQRGLLTTIATEMSVNERTLDRLSREPRRLASVPQSLLLTTSWEHHGPRLAQLLSDQTIFSPMSFYYQKLFLLKQSMQLGVTGADEIENLRQDAEYCLHLGNSVRSDVYSYITRLLASELGKMPN